MSQCFHPDKIKEAASCEPSSFAPMAVADYLEFGNKRPLKSLQHERIHQYAVSSITGCKTVD